MNNIRQFQNIFGWRNPSLADQVHDIALLRSRFPRPLPDLIVEFLQSLSDCVLYYAFDMPLKTGRVKRYSHFVTTNIGPDLPSPYPFPSSIITRLDAWRKMGLGDNIVPLMPTSGASGKWLFCRLHDDRAAVVVPKGDRIFGIADKEWNEISPDFAEFLKALRFDPSPLLPSFRIAGLDEVDESMTLLLEKAMGNDWRAHVLHLLNIPKG